MLSAIPPRALTSHIAFLGKTGVGKTYGVKGAIVEPLLAEHSRVCIVDPTGVYYGLRLQPDGKTPSRFPIVIFGGRHGDRPISELDGEAIAEAVGTTATPVVIDTSDMRVGERTRFFASFAETLLRVNQGPLHLIIDEAHLFAPQGRVNDPQSGKMLGATNNMVSLGRSRGLRITMVSQRPAKLHKDSLTQCETLIAMRLVAPQDRNAVEEWIGEWGDPAIGKKMIAGLSSLANGEGILWAPDPEIGVLDHIKFHTIKTYDSGDARVGNANVKLQPIDMDWLDGRLKEVAAKAAANDVPTLKAEISRLKDQLATAAPAIDPKEFETIYQDGFRAGYETGTDEMRERTAQEYLNILTALRPIVSSIGTELELLKHPAPAGEFEVKTPSHEELDRWAAASAPTPPNKIEPMALVGKAPRGPYQYNVAQRLLDSMAELAALGVRQPSRDIVAAMTGYRNIKSKGVADAFTALHQQGLVTFPTAGCLELTSAGRQKARRVNGAVSSSEMRNRVASIVGKPSDQILLELCGRFPKALARDELANRVGYSNVKSKGFTDAVSKLKEMGFIEYPETNRVKASEILFP